MSFCETKRLDEEECVMWSHLKPAVGVFVGGMSGWAMWELLSYLDRHH
jgi:hypothetical protein